MQRYKHLMDPANSTIRTLGKAIAVIAAMMTAQTAWAANCEYAVVNEWNNGFQAKVTINNPETGTAFRDWQLNWAWNDGTTFSHGWNATYSCSGASCVVQPPAWRPEINPGQSYSFGFIGKKSGNPAAQNVQIGGDPCDNTPVIAVPPVSWQLDGARSSVHYVSMKKDHVAEVNTFAAASGAPAALSGSIGHTGEAIFTLDLNDVSTGVDIRNTRLLAFLFETELLPTAYFRAHVDTDRLAYMQVGETELTTLEGELSLHGMRQAVTVDVLIAKTTETDIIVSTLKPINVDSKLFDMAGGVEALRVIANLSSIGEMVPVYFRLHYQANTDTATQPVDMAEAPNEPSGLVGSFDESTTEARLNWSDNSHQETLFLVRRKPIDGYWQTTAELSTDTVRLIESLPDVGEYDYKVIALNNGVPSLPSNIERITITAGNPLVRGQHQYQENCAGCHGQDGEGIGSFPPLNTERDLDDMMSYIINFMPPSNPGSCDQQCAEDLATYIQTLWITEATCDRAIAPISYGARQIKILTRLEYQNSVEDLLGVDYPAADGLSADTKVSFYANNTHASVVPSSYSNYLLVAEEIAQWSADRNFAPALACSSVDEYCAEQFINTLAPKIFRRPLTDQEHTTYGAMANGAHTNGDIKLGLQMTLEGMLSSPQYLYRHEMGELNPDNTGIDEDAYELTSYEMATFLAYTFTGSTPDQALLDAAERGELRTDYGIINHAQRLAGGAQQVMGDFVGSWLGTADLQVAAKDETAWPNFEALVPHLKQEINTTFSQIMLDPAEQYATLYNGNYSYLNATLAQHYGIQGVTGTELQRTETTERGGILANGAFMARWGESVETSPILRSVRVRRRMLCQDQPDPPAGTFAAREEKLAELSAFLQDPITTNRMKYHSLTADVPCTNCHAQYINPLGFGMEDFDTVGRIRNSDLNGNPIDATGTLYAPLNYSDVAALEHFLGTRGLGNVLAGLPSAQSCLSKQMFRYFMGVGYQEIDKANPSGPQLSDDEKVGYACAIEQLTDTMLNDSPRAMLERIGTLDAVRYRKAWPRH